MNHKEDIQSLLKFLKNKGFSRRLIEQEIGLSEKYLDQIIAKGGNKTIYLKLKDFAEMLEKSNKTVSVISSIKHENNVVDSTTSSILSSLVESNKMLAQANIDYASANKTLAENMAVLTKMLQTNSSVDQKNLVALDAMSHKIRGVLSKLHQQHGKLKSYEEAVAEVNRLFYEIDLAVK